MLRRSFTTLLMRTSAVCLQGWSGSGGGWGPSDSSSGGGWGSVSKAGDGWGGGGDNKSSGGGGGGWGASSNYGGGGRGTDSSSGSGDGGWGSGAAGGGWGDVSRSSQWGGGSGGGRAGRGGGGRWDRGPRGDRGGGWGEDGAGGGGAKGGWGGDGGWRDASGGGRQRGGRGNFRRGRQGGNDGGGRGVWGQPAAADEEAWNAAPPSFQPPVRRVDPLTLTAVEVEVDGVKKLVGQRVQVSGLSDETTWHSLKDHLRQAGDITFCRIYSGGRGMVEFATPEEAARCITELQAAELQGATLYLREDREDTVLLNTRRKIREAREAQLRARKEEAEKTRRARAMAEGDVAEAPAVAHP